MSAPHEYLASHSTSASDPAIAEVKNRAGRALGTLIIPTQRQISLRVTADSLTTIAIARSGDVAEIIHTPIQDIDFIEIREGRSWFLLILGIVTLPLGLVGLIFITLFLILLPDWIVIHTSSRTLILAYDKTEKSKAFCRHLLTLAKQAKDANALMSEASRLSQPVTRMS